MPAPAPPVGTIREFNGKRYRFNGGENSQANWAPVGDAPRPSAPPSDVSGDWGPGARRLPNGDIVRYGPRGGMTVLEHGKPTGAADGAGADLNVSQGTALQWGQEMANAEGNYLRARDMGYDPTDGRNALAGAIDAIPDFGALGGLARSIRDDASDLGFQAQRQWSDAKLRSVSGAAAPESEVRRLVDTYFPGPGENLDVQEGQNRGARQVVMGAVRQRAGPGAAQITVPPVRTPVPDVARNSYERLADPSKPHGSRDNPLLARDRATLTRLAQNPAMRGKWAIGPSGALVQIGSGEVDPRSMREGEAVPARPNRRPAPPRPASNAGWQVLSVE